MKRLLTLLLVSLIVLAPSTFRCSDHAVASVVAQSDDPKDPAKRPDDGKRGQEDPKAVIVYVTKTGKKYHREKCRFLSTSKVAMSLDDAKRKGFTPCKKCKPRTSDKL